MPNGLLIASGVALVAVALLLNPASALAPVLSLIAGGLLVTTLMASRGDSSLDQLPEREPGELRIPPVPDLRPDKAMPPEIGDAAHHEAGRRFQAVQARNRRAGRGFER